MTAGANDKGCSCRPYSSHYLPFFDAAFDSVVIAAPIATQAKPSKIHKAFKPKFELSPVVGSIVGVRLPVAARLAELGAAAGTFALVLVDVL